MTLELYQKSAVEWIRTRRRAICIAPAGSGKTVIAAAAIQSVVTARGREHPVRVGWMANTQEQCQQAHKALDNFPCRIERRVACAAAATDWSDCALLIVDECHHAPAPAWRTQIESCTGARWGFTATPYSEDPERNEAMAVIFGTDRFTIDRQAVARRLAHARVVMLDATDPDLQQPIDAKIATDMRWRQRFWRGDPGQLWGQVAWQACIEMGIVQNRARNEAAVAAALAHRGDAVLVLVNQIEHGDALCARLPGARLCHSKMGAKARREALQAFQAGTVWCIVATSLADEGLDLPRANVLVLVSGGRSSTKTEQRTGRVLRAFAGKEHGTIYDFTDHQHPLMAKHSRRRVEVYRALDYEIVDSQELLGAR
jgi:superfamily II DNA or RNA helicase